MSEFEFRTTADVEEFAQAIWENVGNGVDEKIEDQAWDAVSTQVADAINEDAWDVVSDAVYDAAREAVEEYGGSVDGVEETVSELLRTYNTISVGSHCTIGERATELVTKVIQWHLDTSYEDGGLLSTQVVPSCLPRVEALEAKVAELTGMVSRLEATTAGLRPNHDTPEGTLAHAESTLKHVLIAVQDARGHAVNSGEPF
jgi:hypothetical protein